MPRAEHTAGSQCFCRAEDISSPLSSIRGRRWGGRRGVGSESLCPPPSGPSVYAGTGWHLHITINRYVQYVHTVLYVHWYTLIICVTCVHCTSNKNIRTYRLHSIENILYMYIIAGIRMYSMYIPLTRCRVHKEG